MRKLFFIIIVALLLIALTLIYYRTKSEAQNKVTQTLNETLSEYGSAKFSWKDNETLHIYIGELGKTDDEALGNATKLASVLANDVFFITNKNICIYLYYNSNIHSPVMACVNKNTIQQSL